MASNDPKDQVLVLALEILESEPDQEAALTQFAETLDKADKVNFSLPPMDNPRKFLRALIVENADLAINPEDLEDAEEAEDLRDLAERLVT